jgi:EAL domain-containing protein (putative c-di-GMP-specific phosphodiesterase class I)
MMIADQGTAGASTPWPGLVAPVSVLDGAAGSSGPQRAANESTGAGDLTLGLQPRHALCGGMLRGAEALLRWGEAGAPAGAGAGSEASARMSYWLLEAACREAQLWNAASEAKGPWLGAETPVVVSVDMPARSLREGRLPAEVCLALERSGLAPHLLEIALPEYAVTDGSTEVLLGMSALRDLGVGLALDRFGSVSASLRLLQRLPLTAVKLDPVLTLDLMQDRVIRATVGAAIGLAHALHTNVVATGVNSVSQRDILADMGCDDAQGTMFSGPLAPACFRTALRGVLPEELQ